MKILFIVIYHLAICFCCSAATVDTVVIYSASMKKELKCVVIKPDNYDVQNIRFPVIYLLHGYAGDYSNWISKTPRLKYFANEFQVLIVCPDGHASSWYFDSPVDSAMRYETHIAREVPKFIDEKYKTFQNRQARAITGLSMGGHGALFLAIRNADVFAACGSMSGGVDLEASKNKFEIVQRLGDSVKYAKNWKNYSVINAIEKKPSSPLAIIIDCGAEDHFFPGNRKLHEKMVKLRIPHEYIERPGKHDWNYWVNAIEYQLLFFANYFRRHVK